MEVPVFDHLIITEKGYLSFKAQVIAEATGLSCAEIKKVKS